MVKLKIALFDDSFYPMVDGVANVVHNYATFLSKNHDVTLFTCKPFLPDDRRTYSYKVVRCKCKHVYWGDYPCPDPWTDKEFKKELDQKFDIMHLHSPCAIGHIAVKYGKKYKTPIIQTLHTRYDMDIRAKLKSRFLTHLAMKFYISPNFKACDEMFAMSEGVKKLARRFGYKGKVFVLQNGCDFEEVNIDENQIQEFRNKYVKEDEKLLLYVGRITKVKNIKLMIESAAELKKKNFKYKFVFVGVGKDFEYAKNLVRKLQLENEVIFVGQVSNRKDLQLCYQASDLLVFPSFYDTESLTKIEASAVSLPTLFAEGSITSYSVTDGFNGYIGKAEPSPFADKIISIFKDGEKHKKVRINAKETLYKKWEDIVKQAEEEYYRVIEEFNKKEEIK